VWFVIDAVSEMRLEAFCGAYRGDGRGRAAYDPAMMVGRLLYAYAGGIRSSRAIERPARRTSRSGSWRPGSGRTTQRSRGSSSATSGRSADCSARSSRRARGRGLRRSASLRSTGPGRPRTPVALRTATTSGSRARFSRTPGRPTRPKTGSAVTGAATSSPSNCAPARVGGRGCARPSAGSKPSARARLGRFREAARGASSKPSGVWRRSSGPRSAPTPPTSSTGSGRMRDGRRFGRPRAPTRRPRRRTAGSMSATPTRAS
jgi:hypothetical protein